eukprot:CAMPEP_0194571510 /NCGR_PEP_ID=MMETSP0292-20121207/8464_1 /TAXON_ID=39354 /ORGANISM="Heterosigma akashiwo, Strain CCMP2393" /LENGTH=48 /DNA_ID= /DNA_START= /DNA_END= /DNA_ORIENTATION=
MPGSRCCPQNMPLCSLAKLKKGGLLHPACPHLFSFCASTTMPCSLCCA